MFHPLRIFSPPHAAISPPPDRFQSTPSPAHPVRRPFPHTAWMQPHPSANLRRELRPPPVTSFSPPPTILPVGAPLASDFLAVDKPRSSRTSSSPSPSCIHAEVILGQKLRRACVAKPSTGSSRHRPIFSDVRPVKQVIP